MPTVVSGAVTCVMNVWFPFWKSFKAKYTWRLLFFIISILCKHQMQCKKLFNSTDSLIKKWVFVYLEEKNFRGNMGTVKMLPAESNDLIEKHPLPVKVYKRRWVILVIFILYSAANSFQWMEYSIITSIVKKYYNVSSLAVDWTSIIYMAIYPIIVVPVSYVIDKKVTSSNHLIIIGSRADKLVNNLNWVLHFLNLWVINFNWHGVIYKVLGSVYLQRRSTNFISTASIRTFKTFF